MDSKSEAHDHNDVNLQALAGDVQSLKAQTPARTHKTAFSAPDLAAAVEAIRACQKLSDAAKDLVPGNPEVGR